MHPPPFMEENGIGTFNKLNFLFRDFDNDQNDEENAPIYEKYDALLHGNSRKKTDKIVNIQFMKKYIHIAKCIRPVLTNRASEVIAEEYANLRSADFNSDIARTQPVTARALETLIRLSTAHAKVNILNFTFPRQSHKRFTFCVKSSD